MNLRFGWLFSLIILGISLCFCTYSPDEDYFKDIAPVDPEQFTISLNSYRGDTIYLEEPTDFEFVIQPGNGDVKEVSVLLDGNILSTYTNSVGTFSLQKPRIYDGTFELKIAFKSTSGTGSLADQAGAEGMEVWRSWILKVDLSGTLLPPAPKLTLLQNKGYLEVTWSPYTNIKNNFGHYRLDIESGSKTRSLYFTNIQMTSWIDSAYTGFYYSKYKVIVVNKNGGTSSEASTNNQLKATASYNPMDSLVTIDIPKPLYYSAIQSFTIAENNVVVGTLTDFNHLQFKFKPGKIGYNYSTSIDLSLIPKISSPYVAYWYGTVNISVPLKTLPSTFQAFHFNQDLQAIIGYTKSGSTATLHVLQASDLSPVRTVEMFNGPGYSVPYKGSHAFFSRPDELVRINLATGEELSIDAIKTTYGSGPSKITGSRNSIVSYHWFNSNSYYRRIVDITTDNTIWLQTTNDINHFVIISDDNQYALTQNKIIYRISGSALQLIGTLNYSGTWLGFRQDKCEEIITYSSTAVYIYDADNLNLKRTINRPSTTSTFKMFDVATGMLIFSNATDKKIHAVNIDTGDVKEFNINLSNPVVLNGFLFINGNQYLKLY